MAAGKPAAGPQSSSLWSGLISHLRASVTVKRRRVHLRAHGDCFLGSEAADVVTEHVNHAKDLEGACAADNRCLHKGSKPPSSPHSLSFISSSNLTFDFKP